MANSVCVVTSALWREWKTRPAKKKKGSRSKKTSMIIDLHLFSVSKMVGSPDRYHDQNVINGSAQGISLFGSTHSISYTGIAVWIHQCLPIANTRLQMKCFLLVYTNELISISIYLSSVDTPHEGVPLVVSSSHSDNTLIKCSNSVNKSSLQKPGLPKSTKSHSLLRAKNPLIYLFGSLEPHIWLETELPSNFRRFNRKLYTKTGKEKPNLLHFFVLVNRSDLITWFSLVCYGHWQKPLWPEEGPGFVVTLWHPGL